METFGVVRKVRLEDVFDARRFHDEDERRLSDGPSVPDEPKLLRFLEPPLGLSVQVPNQLEHATNKRIVLHALWSFVLE